MVLENLLSKFVKLLLALANLLFLIALLNAILMPSLKNLATFTNIFKLQCNKMFFQGLVSKAFLYTFSSFDGT
jgi:hypothetical protein